MKAKKEKKAKREKRKKDKRHKKAKKEKSLKISKKDKSRKKSKKSKQIKHTRSQTTSPASLKSNYSWSSSRSRSSIKSKTYHLRSESYERSRSRSPYLSERSYTKSELKSPYSTYRSYSRSRSPYSEHRSYTRSRSRSIYSYRSYNRSRSRTRERSSSHTPDHRYPYYRGRSPNRRFNYNGRFYRGRSNRGGGHFIGRGGRYLNDRHQPRPFLPPRRELSRELEQLDKQKLLQIAIKNATRMAIEGKLPEGMELAKTMKNKTIDELVGICKQLRETGETSPDRLENVSSDDEEYDRRMKKRRRRSHSYSDDEFLPRPIQPVSKIEINITNRSGKVDDNVLRLSFPVSSGVQHRSKVISTQNEWIPVRDTPSPMAKTATPFVKALEKAAVHVPVAYNFPTEMKDQSAIIGPALMPPRMKLDAFKFDEMIKLPPPPVPPTFEKSEQPLVLENLESETISLNSETTQHMGNSEQTASLKKIDLPRKSESASIRDTNPKSKSDCILKITTESSSLSESIPDKLKPPPVPPVLVQPKTNSVTPEALLRAIQTCNAIQNGSVNRDVRELPLTFKIQPPPPPELKREDLVFEIPKIVKRPPTNITELLEKRAKYNERLQNEPDDIEMRKEVERIDEEMSAWAASKNLPGSFTGSTGARVLSADQLAPRNPRFQAWAKKDQFKTAPVFQGGIGSKLLQKMGWQPGHGLGKTEDGQLEPLLMDIKSDRRGLSARDDKRVSKKEILNINGKNPVSIVIDLCQQRGWKPQFTCAEMGPAHNKRFLWKAILNGVEYEPSVPATNKKAGKSQVCLVILQALGLVEPMAHNK